ncbi:methyl-accepting chemotaxis protein [Paenibacillus physcomitrellae]|uniref:Methyl-accepting chemotaxis protein TlpB n=1 Tax=Paenibacillus physcomitrellae TaxID=1619311 RepID=A0ABQ1FZT7_9BACL|nr:methyl-accepting chemotaxis protein [Paenibacillus physcomitrellae]GGA33840.1 methyl-accepting chemotaxis protein TlpB [Paenibacillus physcomitrellae]
MKVRLGEFRKGSLSLKLKLIALLLVLTVIPVVLVSSISTRLYSGILEQEIRQQQAIIASTNASQLNDLLEAKVASLESMAEQYRDVFLQEDSQKVIAQLKLMKAMNPDVISYSFSDEQGHLVNEVSKTFDISQTANFKRILKEKNVGISDITHDLETNQSIIIIDYPLLGDASELVGVIQAVVSPNQILEQLNRNKMGETSSAFLLSKTGTYLAYPEAERVGKNVKEFESPTTSSIFENEVLKNREGSTNYKLKDGTSEMASYAQVGITGWRVVAAGEESDLMKEARQSEQFGYIFIVICALVIAVISYFAANYILRPIYVLIRLMKKAAAGDLTERLPVKGKDEMEQLKEHTNIMLDSFTLTLQKLGEAVQYTSASSKQLTAISLDSLSATEQTASAVVQMTKGSEVQVEGSEQSASAMEEMSIGIQRIAESSSIVNERTMHVQEQIAQGDQVVQDAVVQIINVREAADRSAAMIQKLESHSSEIDQIVSYISEIAQQTNLLSLNASIEAARAGEHGRGFAVVADEVKKLAEQTARSTGTIADIMSQIRNAAAETSKSITEEREEVSKSVMQIEQVGDVFSAIIHAVNEVSNQINEVSAATQQLSASTEEVSASMQEMVGISRGALNELSGIATKAEEQHRHMEKISASSEALSLMAVELEELVAGFKTSKENDIESNKESNKESDKASE